MEKKLTYQKLKERVASLEGDIRELVLNPDSFESHVIKDRILFIDKMEKQLLMGERSGSSEPKGLMGWIDDRRGIRQVGRYSVKFVDYSSITGHNCRILDIWITSEMQKKIGEDCTKDADIRRLTITGNITYESLLKKADLIFNI